MILNDIFLYIQSAFATRSFFQFSKCVKLYIYREEHLNKWSNLKIRTLINLKFSKKRKKKHFHSRNDSFLEKCIFPSTILYTKETVSPPLLTRIPLTSSQEQGIFFEQEKFQVTNYSFPVVNLQLLVVV